MERSRYRTPFRDILGVSLAGLTLLASPVALADDSLDSLLEPVREKYHMPALAAAVVKDGEIVAIGAVGTRQWGREIPVTPNDRFHIGSDTKAITATLAGIEVERGRLKWSTTIGETFPELRDKMDPAFAAITLEQLLSHTSGLPADTGDFVELLNKAGLAEGGLPEQRLIVLNDVMTKTPGPGGHFTYSNLGYLLAGIMLERVTGESWEQLATDEVLDPLKLDGAGFGPQMTTGRVDAPLPHYSTPSIQPILYGYQADNPPILGPAGTVHMGVKGFAKWVAWNAAEGRRGPALVQPETLRKLHTPVVSMTVTNPKPGTPHSGRYALGWAEITMDWAKEPLVFHGGSNEKDLAHAYFQPKYDFGIVLLTNIQSPAIEQAFFDLAGELYKKYGPAEGQVP